MMNFRIGHGYDVHALARGSCGWGGIRIEHALGCVAHSDGDVLIHALCDALLGAAAIGDIGCIFRILPKRTKGIDSKILLRRTVELIGRQGYAIGNVDCTLCLQRPKSNRTFQPCAKRWPPRWESLRKPYRSRRPPPNASVSSDAKGIEAHAVALIFKP